MKKTILLIACLLLAACQIPGLPGSDGGAGDSTPAQASDTPAPPTETPTPTAVPSGPCENPLMSLNVGNLWRYRATSTLGSSEQEMRVVEWNEEVGLNAVVEMLDVASGVVNTDLVTCLDDGGIEDFPLFFVSLQLGDYLDGVFNTFYNSGIYAPGYEQLEGADWVLEWQAEYLTEDAVCFVAVVGDNSMCINRTSPIDLTFSTQGAHEDVSVPAGDFPDALVVTFSFRMATALIFPGIATSAPMTITTTQWYAPFLGLVRAEVETASFEFITGQPSTMEIESVIELLEFSPAP